MKAVKDHFKQYKFGVDVYAIGLAILLLLPFFVWLGVRADGEILSRIAKSGGVQIAAYVFGGVSLFGVIFLVNEKKGKPDFFSLFFLLVALSALIDIVAWVFYFCNYANAAVLLFLAGFPAAAIGLWAAMRKNYITLLPVVLYFALNIASVASFL